MSQDSPDAEAKLVPNAAQHAAYDRDFYSWTLEQARLIRVGRFDALDRENVAEEIESLGREQFSKLRSAIRVVLLLMLTCDYQPERRSRSWIMSIEAQRSELDDVLDGNPGLRPRIPEAIDKAYRRARIEASAETSVDRRRFPEQCPYDWNDIIARDFAE